MADSEKRAEIGLVAAISIGVGGMIGAGVFSILGVVASISGSAMPISFAIGAVVAGLAAYGYAALGKTFPTVGGAVTFLVRGYGEGVASGSLNLFQYFSYIITIALFAAYAATFVDLPSKVWAVGVVLAFTAINFLGARIMGRAESVIVIIKVAILILFVAAAFTALPGGGFARLSPSTWPGPLAIFTGAGVLFVGYEGFGLITNAAANMEKPRRELPRALYASVAIVSVIYVLVASGVVTNVPLNLLKGLGDSALAVAAKPSLGQAGFRLIAIAALLSTASAVNATLLGSTTSRIKSPRTAVFHQRRVLDGLGYRRGLFVLYVTEAGGVENVRAHPELLGGLSVIIEAIKESRKIVQRMNSYAIYRIAETLRVLLFITLAILILNFYPVTAVMIVMLALLNDGAILSIAYDNVHYKHQPEAWDMRLVLGIATVLGIVGPVAAFGLLLLGDQVFGLNHAHLQTLM